MFPPLNPDFLECSSQITVFEDDIEHVVHLHLALHLLLANLNLKARLILLTILEIR
mgnify:CR=1 FL=1